MIGEPIMITILIVGVVLLALVFIAMTVLIYHQMLLFNELNKRILVKSIDDQEKYEGAIAQLAQAEAELQHATDSILRPKGPLDDSDEEIHDLDLE